MKVDPSVILVAAVAVGLSGCRMSVPVHVWEPAQLESTVGGRVALGNVAGPSELAQQIEEALISGAPRDSGRSTELVDAETLQGFSPIQLASFQDDETNDVALAAVARQQHFDYMLHGELVASRRSYQQPQSPDQVTVSWRLTELSGMSAPQGRPVVVNVDKAFERYPDLLLMSDEQAAVATAVARETYRLITPSVAVQQVPLAIPYFLPGSRAVRLGNAHARAGDWAEAERVWSDAAERYPGSTSAQINLAIAAVAAQDFTRAKQLARDANRKFPSKLARKTQVWVELTQRDYHEAFNLPDPPEGWFVTRSESVEPATLR